MLVVVQKKMSERDAVEDSFEEEDIVYEDDDELVDSEDDEESVIEDSDEEDALSLASEVESLASEVESLASDVESVFSGSSRSSSSDSSSSSRSSKSWKVSKSSKASRSHSRSGVARSSNGGKSSGARHLSDDSSAERYSSPSDDESTVIGCDFVDDIIVAEIIAEVRDVEPEKWCRLFEGSFFTNGGQLGHANLPSCVLNEDCTKVTVPSMYVKDIRSSNDLKLQAQTRDGTFRLPSISMSRRKFHTKPVDLTPLSEGWRSTKIGNRYFMSEETGAETGGYGLAQVVNKDNANELIVPRCFLEKLRDFVVRLNWKRGYAVFEVSRVGEDWFSVWNLQILGREEGGHAPFETNEKSQSALAITGGAKRYKKEYETARELGVKGSGKMIREYEAETIREPISAKDYVPTFWPNGKIPLVVDDPRLEVPGLEICRTADPDGGIQYEEKACSFFLPKPLYGLTFDLHSKELHKERLDCMGLFKAQDGELLTDGYSTALSALGATFLDVPVPEYVRIDDEMAGEISLVLCDEDSDRDVIALRCLKTKKYHEEVRKAFRELRKNLPSVPGTQMLKKAGAASLKSLATAATVSATVAASVAVGAAAEGTVVLDTKQKKKKTKSSTVNNSSESGRRVQVPVYEVSPLLRISQRWYDPTTLKLTFLKDHKAPRKLRYVDIRLKKPKKKKNVKSKKSSGAKSSSRKKHEQSVGTRSGKHAPNNVTDEQRSIVSEKTTEFADGTVKKETFFSDGTKVTVHSESMDDIVVSSKASAKNVPAVVTPMNDGDDDGTKLTEFSTFPSSNKTKHQGTASRKKKQGARTVAPTNRRSKGSGTSSSSSRKKTQRSVVSAPAGYAFKHGNGDFDDEEEHMC